MPFLDIGLKTQEKKPLQSQLTVHRAQQQAAVPALRHRPSCCPPRRGAVPGTLSPHLGALPSAVASGRGATGAEPAGCSPPSPWAPLRSLSIAPAGGLSACCREMPRRKREETKYNSESGGRREQSGGTEAGPSAGPSASRQDGSAPPSPELREGRRSSAPHPSGSRTAAKVAPEAALRRCYSNGTAGAAPSRCALRWMRPRGRRGKRELRSDIVLAVIQSAGM